MRTEIKKLKTGIVIDLVTEVETRKKRITKKEIEQQIDGLDKSIKNLEKRREVYQSLLNEIATYEK